MTHRLILVYPHDTVHVDNIDRRAALRQVHKLMALPGVEFDAFLDVGPSVGRYDFDRDLFDENATTLDDLTTIREHLLVS